MQEQVKHLTDCEEGPPAFLPLPHPVQKNDTKITEIQSFLNAKNKFLSTFVIS